MREGYAPPINYAGLNAEIGTDYHVLRLQEFAKVQFLRAYP